MSASMLVLTAVVVAYAAAFPIVRSRQRADDTLEPKDAFLLWVLWPLALVIEAGLALRRIPQLMFPTPQATLVRRRLLGTRVADSVAEWFDAQNPKGRK